MKAFKVITWGFNEKDIVYYDIMPYLIKAYKKSEDKPKTHEEFNKFIEFEGRYMWWARCEYEIIVVSWPYIDTEPLKESKKIDVWKQVEMNLDIISNILEENVKEIQ